MLSSIASMILHCFPSGRAYDNLSTGDFFVAEHTSGNLNIQGAPLYYEVAGQGHPLLLIHAGIADSRMWDQQFDTFARQYRVIRFDLRGFGQSTVPAGAFANHEDPAALLAFLGIEKAHVVAL